MAERSLKEGERYRRMEVDLWWSEEEERERDGRYVFVSVGWDGRGRNGLDGTGG